MLRVFDIVFSLVALTVLSPILVTVSVILRFTGENEIFFTQERIGKGRQLFRLLKFATMLKDSPNIGTGTITVRNDPRVLPVGKFLRKTKINELPQLFNVLTGDMSLIGPRPQDIQCFEAFPIDMQDVVASVTPGLSGIGSIVFRDEEELMDEAGEPDLLYEQVIMPYKAMLEAWYVENNSVTLYFLLIFATIFAVAAPKMVNLRRLFPSLPQAPEGLESKLFG